MLVEHCANAGMLGCGNQGFEANVPALSGMTGHILLSIAHRVIRGWMFATTSLLSHPNHDNKSSMKIGWQKEGTGPDGPSRYGSSEHGDIITVDARQTS